MKRNLKALAFFVLPSLMIVGFYSFKKYEEIKSRAAILKDLLFGHYCLVIVDDELASKEKSWMADSSYYIEKQKNVYRFYYSPIECSEVSPVYFTNHVAGAIELKDSNGYDLEGYDFEKSFKAIFKKDIRKKPTVKNGFENASFSADAIQTAFNKTYPKPTELVDGFVMQKVYDLSIKQYSRACAYVMADVMKNKTAFMQQVNTYKAKAATSKWDDGIGFCTIAAEAVLGKDYLSKRANETTKKYLGDYYDRLVGMMMRRQIDGTLPVILNCIKTVLKDYDPSFYETMKAKF
jgi:hypothetical protein